MIVARRRIVFLVFAAVLVFVGIAAFAGLFSPDPETQAHEYVRSGDAYVERGALQEAIIEYRNALKLRPNWAAVRYKLGRVYQDAGDPVNAYNEYARAGDLDPSNADAHVRAGTLLLVAREFDLARTRAELALEAEPGRADAHILLGNALAGLNDTGAALEQIEQAIALDPNYAPAWTALGAVQFVGGRRDEAAAAFQRAVEIAPKSADAHLALANYQWAAGNTAAAEATFKRALSLDQKNAAANRGLALLYLTTQRAPAAEPHFKALAETQPGGRIALADYYMGIGRSDAATAVLREVEGSKEKEQARAARLRLAAIAYADDRKTEAHAIVDELLAERPRFAEARTAKARMLLSDGRPAADALEHARKAVEADARLPLAHYTLGLAALASRNLDEAERAFRETARLSPRAAAAQLQLARIELARGDVSAARNAAREAQRLKPRDAQAAILVSQTLRAEGKPADAWSELTSLPDATRASAPVQTELGWVALERRQFPAARAAFEEALRLAPTSADARSGLVAAELAEGNPDAARGHVREWRKAMPNDVSLSILAARVELAARNAPAAQQILEKVIAADASQLEAYELLAQAHAAQGQTDRVLAQYETLASVAPQPAAARTMVGILQEARGDRAKARTAYEQALAADPRSGVAANNLAWMYAEDGRLDEAMRLADVAREQLRRRPEAEDTTGWIYLKKGLATRAIASFERARERAPQNPVYHYHLGLAYKQAGDADRARAAFERALKLKSDFDGAEDARRQLAEITRP